MDTVKSYISRRFLFCLVFLTFLPLHCLQTSQLGQQVSSLPSASTNYTLKYQRKKEREGSAFPRACFCRKSRNRGDLKNTRFMWFTPCFSHRHLQWIHHPLAELFKVITKNGNNHPKCKCPFP